MVVSNDVCFPSFFLILNLALGREEHICRVANVPSPRVPALPVQGHHENAKSAGTGWQFYVGLRSASSSLARDSLGRARENVERKKENKVGSCCCFGQSVPPSRQGYSKVRHLIRSRDFVGARYY